MNLKKYYKLLKAEAPLLAAYAGSWIWVFIRGETNIFTAPLDVHLAIVINIASLMVATFLALIYSGEKKK